MNDLKEHDLWQDTLEKEILSIFKCLPVIPSKEGEDATVEQQTESVKFLEAFYKLILDTPNLHQVL